MPETKKPAKKYPSFTMRLSEKELDFLSRQARWANLTPAAYVRKLIAGTDIKAGEDLAVLREVKAALGPVGNNVNQIARHLNRYRADAHINAMTMELSAVRSDLSSILALLEKR